jgi:hypothetical protein
MIVFILCLLIHGFISPANELNDLEKRWLKGSVKSVMETKYTLSGKEAGAPKDKIVFRKLTLFDKYGYEVENTLYQSDDESLKSIFSFGSDGKPSGMTETKSDGTLNLSVVYNYNDKGILSEAVYNWGDDHTIGDIGENSDYYYEIIQNELFTKVLYTVEYRGFITEEKYLKSDGTLSFTITNKYDPRANRLESAYYHGNGRLSWNTKYTYDRYDNLVESRLFKSNRIAVLSKYKHQFDETGNWIERLEEREVYVNILTAGLDSTNMVTERTIEYY